MYDVVLPVYPHVLHQNNVKTSRCVFGDISFLVRNCNVWIILDVENNVEIETIQGLGFAVCECKLWGAQ